MSGVRSLGAALALCLFLAACEDEAADAVSAVPEEPGTESIAHYCGMIITDHPGPKGQIFLDGQPAPVWFASVRDTFAFTILPDEQKDIRAIFVNDMGRVANWDRPEPGTWVAARDAFYVAGSAMRDGMGAREIVPFGNRELAQRFAADHGGELFRFGEIPERFVLGSYDDDAEPPEANDPASTGEGRSHGESDGKPHD